MADAKTRRRARERAMQFLHHLDVSGGEWEDTIKRFWEAFPTKKGAREYGELLIAGVSEHRETLDTEIESALQNWSPSRVGRIERNILRIALFEMEHRDDVPEKVAINEAIEIAKQYGPDEAPGFVNGVLDRLISKAGAAKPKADD